MVISNRSLVAKEAWQTHMATPCDMILKSCPVLEAADHKETLRLLPDVSHARIVDLASGIGRFTDELAKRASHLTSVEFVPKFLEKNRETHSSHTHIDYVLADAMDVNFISESIDFVFINWLFLYLADDEAERLVGRIANWLSKGGKVFFRETCSPKRIEPTYNNVSCYRPRDFYEQLFLQHFVLLQKGSFVAWLEHANQAFSCYWLMEKQ